MGVEHVPWFRRHRSLAIRKSPEFPYRNAKTRWGEPAGHFASSHLAVTVLMEAPGIEPGSRDVSMQASTCVVNALVSLGRASIDKTPSQTSRKHFLTAAVFDMGRGGPNLATDFWI
jgi:hypothetical protein